MLEDDITWVTRKALKARNLAPAQAARLASRDQAEVLAFTRGHFDPQIALALAPVLGLDPPSFAALPLYQPQTPPLDALHRLEFPFHDGSVNAWLLTRDGHSILIDAGGDALECARRLDQAGVSTVVAFLTHDHGDHSGGFRGLGKHCSRRFAPAAARLPEALPLAPDDIVDCGPFRIRAIDLDGHWHGALGYVIDGLDTPVCAVGDALFAGSVGGTPDPDTHRRALDLIRRHVLVLPPQTILLPGHGPATTVAQELASNPFFAGPA